MRMLSLLAAALLALACTSKTDPGPVPTDDAAADLGPPDAALDLDAAEVATPDAAPPDGGAPDASVVDVPRDQGSVPDVPSPIDRPLTVDVTESADASTADAPDAGSCGAVALPPRTGSPVAMGTTSGASTLEGSCGGDESSDSAFSWTAPRAGTYLISTQRSAYDTVLYVLDGGCDGPEIDCNDDAEGTLSSELSVTLRTGQTIIIVVDGYSGADGAFELSIIEDATDTDAGPPDA